MRTGIAFLLGAVAAMILLLSAEQPRAAAAELPPAELQRWEYRVATLDELCGSTPGEELGRALEAGFAGLALALAPDDGSPAARDARQRVQDWNARVVAAFDRAGAEGWELVQVVEPRYYFKRPAQGAPTAPPGSPE